MLGHCLEFLVLNVHRIEKDNKVSACSRSRLEGRVARVAKKGEETYK